MFKKSKFIIIYLLIFFTSLSFIHFSFLSVKSKAEKKLPSNENHFPVVKIISPKNNSAFNRNQIVSYEITVSDKEDGESKYDEINSKEVFLEIKYVKKISPALHEIQKSQSIDPNGLAIIKTSNCMNCHAFKTKLIGPSFYEITQRYHKFPATEDTLANHILNGSKGRWGEVQMPSNSKLNQSEAKEVIDWVFKNANDSTVDFLAGLDGSFRLNPPDTSFNYVMLIASYTDHGTKDEPAKNLKGEDTIFISCK